jgi:hypothetical protein
VASYKQPRRLNAVSLTLLGLVGLAGYVAHAAWPAIALNADLASAIEDALPRLYRANLLPEPESSVGADEVKQSLVERLAALGLERPEDRLTVARDAKVVAIGLAVPVVIHLALLHLSFPVTLRPHAETSAARVSY